MAMVVMVDDFGSGFWLWVSWFMVVVVAVGCGCGCDDWLSWLVVVVAGGDGVVGFFFFSFLRCVMVARVEWWLWLLVEVAVVFIFLLFYCIVYVICYFIMLKAKIKPLIQGVL